MIQLVGWTSKPQENYILKCGTQNVISGVFCPKGAPKSRTARSSLSIGFQASAHRPGPPRTGPNHALHRLCASPASPRYLASHPREVHLHWRVALWFWVENMASWLNSFQTDLWDHSPFSSDSGCFRWACPPSLKGRPLGEASVASSLCPRQSRSTRVGELLRDFQPGAQRKDHVVTTLADLCNS